MSKEDFQYKRSDSIIEPLEIIDNKIQSKYNNLQSKYNNYKNIIVGASVYLASLITRRESFEGDIDRYKESARVSPILEMRKISKILREYYNLLRSNGVSVDHIPEIIKRRIRREEGKLEKTLEEKGVTDAGEGKARKRIYYTLKNLVKRYDHHNGFYRDVGKEIGKLLLEDTDVVKDYEYFIEKYEQIGTEGKREAEKVVEEVEKGEREAEGVEEVVERIERGIEHERVILVARELERQEKLVMGALKFIRR